MNHFTSYLISLALCIIGVILITTTSLVYDYLVQQEMVLKNGSYVFKHWQKTQFPLESKIYLFNWTNPEDFLNTSVKMHFTEMEPLRMRHINERFNVTWNNNSTLTYQQRYIFNIINKELLTKNLTTLDFVHAIGAYRMRYWKTLWKMSVKMSTNFISNSFHRTYTVDEMTFHGYDDPYYRILKMFPHGSFGVELPTEFQRLGMIHGRNYSTFIHGHINVGTSYENLGKVYQWNFNDVIPYYGGECAKIKGSTGEISPPHALDGKDFINFFIADSCGDVVLDYVGEEYVHTIKGYRYEVHSYLDNGTFYPERGCYELGEKMPFGFFNISNCQFETPVFVSLPHFYKADSSYFEHVDGMQPDPEKHSFYAVVEPNVNIPMKSCGRIQLNWFIRSYKFTLYEKVRQMMFPAMWFELCMEIPPELYIRIKLITIFQSSQTILGGAFMLLGAMTFLCQILKQRKLLMTKNNNKARKCKKTSYSNEECEYRPIKQKLPTIQFK